MGIELVSEKGRNQWLSEKWNQQRKKKDMKAWMDWWPDWKDFKLFYI